MTSTEFLETSNKLWVSYNRDYASFQQYSGDKMNDKHNRKFCNVNNHRYLLAKNDLMNQTHKLLTEQINATSYLS